MEWKHTQVICELTFAHSTLNRWFYPKHNRQRYIYTSETLNAVSLQLLKCELPVSTSCSRHVQFCHRLTNSSVLGWAASECETCNALTSKNSYMIYVIIQEFLPKGEVKNVIKNWKLKSKCGIWLARNSTQNVGNKNYRQVNAY